LFAGLAHCVRISDDNVISFDPIVVYLFSRKEESMHIDIKASKMEGTNAKVLDDQRADAKVSGKEALDIEGVISPTYRDTNANRDLRSETSGYQTCNSN
jgi:hypothetical protein